MNDNKLETKNALIETGKFGPVYTLERGSNGTTKKWLLTAFDIIKRPK
jgi:hypothetical protein